MKKLGLLIATIVASFCFSIPAFGALTNTLDIDRYEVKWSDEFDGTELNRRYWTPQVGNGNAYGVWEWGNNEKEFYKEDNISVSDGTLKLNAKYEAGAGSVGSTTYNFSSGRIYSKQLVNIGLGYVEARIKIPSAAGIWPAFWMLGTNGKTWPSCGEIDIMEAFNTRTYLQSTVHFPDSNGKDLYTYYQKTLTDKTQWHTYGCYRDGNICAFYYDRQLVGFTETSDGNVGAWSAANSYSWQSSIYGTRSVLNDDHYLLFNIACGGNLAGGMPNSSLDVNMEVDYCRYYVEKPEESSTEKVTDAPTTQPTTKSVVAPGRASIKKATNVKKRKISITLKKISDAKGYQIRWCDSKKFQGYEQKNITKVKYTLKGLDKGTYFIKVRAYKKNGSKTLYGAWSKVKKVKVKK